MTQDTSRQPPFLITGMSPDAVRSATSRLAPVYDDYGAIVFRGLLKEDFDFLTYRSEIARLANTLIARFTGNGYSERPLEEAITELARIDRPAVGKIFDLGTRPAKLLSAMRLKVSPAVVALAEMALGPGALIATPSQSDTLHIFPPGEENWRYNLPEHQDYPYLLQSPRQVTFWINFGAMVENVGGVTFWAGSHRLGICPQRRGERGYFTTVVDHQALEQFEQFDCTAGIGDVLVMNSLTIHRSIVNRTNSGSRVVQLFRFSDLTDAQSINMQWSSAEFRGGGMTFEAAHPELIAS